MAARIRPAVIVRRVRYRARIRVSLRKRAFAQRNNWPVWRKTIRVRQCDGIRDATRSWNGKILVVCRPLGHLPRQGSGDRVMDGTRWKISTIPSRARSQAESNSFPIERGAARGGGSGVRLIRGNILVSRRITSYVCINLSCLGTESRAHS